MEELIINPKVPNLTNEAIEEKAQSLIDRYCDEIEHILIPPIPVEKIADLLLKLSIDWAPILDTDNEPILAMIRPKKRTITLNEKRRKFFDKYFGTLEFTYGHEIGHHELHIEKPINIPDIAEIREILKL